MINSILGLSDSDIQSLAVTLKLATVTTAVLLCIASPIAYWLSRMSPRWKRPLVSFFSLPMVLPPTVVGFYLLLLLGPQGMIGTWLAAQGLGPIVFTFPGLVIGSVIYSFPFAFQPIQAAFEAIGQRPLEVAGTLRSSGWDSFRYITMPLAAPGVLRAAVLAFAHTVGEFGVVLMIGGGLPGRTKLVSVQLFEYVEGLDFQSAHRLSWVMVLFSFFAMWLVSLLDSKSGRAEG